MHELGLKASENDVDDLLKEFDTDNNGAIDYNEFVVMMASSMKAAQEQDQILESFRIFDFNNQKSFGAEELEKVCEMLGCMFSKEEIHEMIDAADSSGDHKIYFEEFVRIMLAHD
eukprot:Macronucleus_8695.p1 GENE.Macronucleus_8695~~Macronucleus_8695.p1  ORF type:complete len:115 (+),score=34.34 Macronucleus_8695:1-345(+)